VRGTKRWLSRKAIREVTVSPPEVQDESQELTDLLEKLKAFEDEAEELDKVLPYIEGTPIPRHLRASLLGTALQDSRLQHGRVRNYLLHLKSQGIHPQEIDAVLKEDSDFWLRVYPKVAGYEDLIMHWLVETKILLQKMIDHLGDTPEDRMLTLQVSGHLVFMEQALTKAFMEKSKVEE
jgi:hypothetical protein